MTELYEEYPVSIVCQTSFQTFLSYLIGLTILYIVGGLIFGSVYILLAILLLLLSMRFRCSYCYYYEKRCATGLGALCGLLFKKRESSDFSNSRNVSIVAIPSFLLMFLPLIAGIVYILFEFSWSLLSLLLLYSFTAIVLGFAIRKSLLCKSCKQGEIGCLAYQGMKGIK